MSLAPASKVGPYLVERLIGRGGMGEVYLGRDPRLDRAVALKIVPADKNWDETRRARLLNEARTVSSLHHPNIVVVYDIVHENGADVVVMEYVQGKTLDELIPRRGLRLGEALHYAIPMADGLAAAHRAGVVHRDLKPANVIVDESGTVKLLDFGLAKTVGLVVAEDSETRSIGATLTGEGTIVGTVSYMSPEQAEGKAVDARTDIFSFGCLLYEMVTGRKAFERESQAATLSAILREEPRPASESNRIPREMDRIIGKCLRKNPDRRWQSMADVRGLLQDLKEDSESGALDTADTRPTPAGWRSKLWAGVALVTVLTILAVAALWWMRRSNPETALVPVRLTSYPGSEYDPAFSPDGNQIAFVWDGEDQTTPHIYVKLVGATDALRLTKDRRPERYPAWSRDGRWIAFNRRAEDGRANIIVTSALGGAERKIGELQACCSRLSWSPDAKWLVTGEHLESNVGRLILLNVETGEKRVVLSTPTGAFGDYDPAFSPSGRAIAFARSGGTKNDIFVVPLSEDMKASGPASPVTTDGAWNGEPAWTPDGQEIVYVSGLPGYLAGEEGVWTNYSRLWRVRLSGHNKPRQIAFAQEGSSQPSIAMNGHRMAYHLVTFDSNIWRIPVGSGPAAPAIVAASTRDEFSPSYSPDGSKIVFSSMRTGVHEVWVSDADGSNPQQLTRFGRGYSGSPQFSPDGERIAFDSAVTGSYEIYTMAVDGGNPVRLTRIGIESAAPHWSRDGKRIYFESVRTGRREIWMIPASGGEPVQITRNGGFEACESPDGAELYYTKVYGGGPVWKMRLTGGPETKVIDNVQFRGFTLGKNALYYVRPVGGNTSEFMRVPYAGGTPELLGKAESVSLGFALSPDERWLAYAKYDNNGADLMLVENFR
jgi:Tol biopolymer transport system component/serine/threonine protein kinase